MSNELYTSNLIVRMTDREKRQLAEAAHQAAIAEM